jgi:hypothetical protein
LRGKVYPDYALAIGWILVAIPIIAIPIGAIYQINKYKDNPVSYKSSNISNLQIFIRLLLML